METLDRLVDEAGAGSERLLRLNGLLGLASPCCRTGSPSIPQDARRLPWPNAMDWRGTDVLEEGVMEGIGGKGVVGVSSTGQGDGLS